MSSNTKPELDVKLLLYRQGVHSTLDGLAKFLAAHRRVLKLFWAVVLLTLLGSCAFVLIHAILDYFAYEIVTTITVRNEMPAQMPTVILCDSNSLMTLHGVCFASSIYKAYNISISNNYLNYRYYQSSYPRMINNKGNILLPRTMAMSASRDPSLSDAIRQSLGLSFTDMLISCSFNSVECTANDFLWQYDTYFGNCFKFNGSV